MDYSLPIEQRDIDRANRLNPGPVSALISSVGRVEINGQSYFPVLELEVRMENITLDVLREFVVRMSQTATPAVERTAAYNVNALPGSSWAETGDGPVLTNPDDICPGNYEEQSMAVDMQDVRAFVNLRARKGY